jgi:hypothetical protein
MSVYCECGAQVSANCLKKHKATKKHKELLELKKIQNPDSDSEYEIEPKSKYEKQKEYYERNKEKIAEKHKAYRETNHDVIISQNRAYKEQNHEKVLEQRKDYRQLKITCTCGCEVIKNNLAKHLKSDKHKAKIETTT